MHLHENDILSTSIFTVVCDLYMYYLLSRLWCVEFLDSLGVIDAGDYDNNVNGGLMVDPNGLKVHMTRGPTLVSAYML